MDGSDPRDSPSSRRSRWFRLSAISIMGAAALLWWWWPAIARDPDRLDVLVLGVGEVRESAEPISRRIREEGMSVEIDIVDPCVDTDGVASFVAERDPAVVVLGPRRSCDDWIAVVDAVRIGSDRRVITLAQTGALDATDRRVLRELDVTLADPSRLLGPASVERFPCQWWDDCDPDGQVAIRRSDGTLTDAGAERVARVLTGNIP